MASLRPERVTAPPQVDYELTPIGRELLTLVTGICEWTRRNIEAIETSRRGYGRARDRSAPARHRRAARSGEQRLEHQKAPGQQTDLGLLMWCAARDSNPGPAD
ncbi:winged helix-turn-helix transcriptional regulator [Sinosporangium siamense]|uniref:winged helix-turn-helix transcriptional regulator n=1 Tax=Sinosporangium siamense TaxID=1367973 RepID=UPI0035E4AB05